MDPVFFEATTISYVQLYTVYVLRVYAHLIFTKRARDLNGIRHRFYPIGPVPLDRTWPTEGGLSREREEPKAASRGMARGFFLLSCRKLDRPLTLNKQTNGEVKEENTSFRLKEGKATNKKVSP